MNTRRRGLTLLEVLLATAIVGVLAGLVLPSLQSARKQSKLSACMANLRQLGLAYGLYAEEYGAYPEPARFVRWVGEQRGDRRILTCPEDGDPARAASSYTFRTVLPPDFRPYWQNVELDPNTVLVVCNHHLEERVRERGGARARSAPGYPFKPALRASGAVHRIHVDAIRRRVVPGSRPAYARVYPAEPGYEQARGR
jgi:prepilin-type N-terminal cleavage/methylation domain-containing protein